MIATVLRYWNKTLSRVSDYFLVSSLVPKRPDPVERFDAPTLEAEGIAIVMQGPICKAHDFTYETLRSYRAKYPAATIVLSTWVGESRAVLQRIKDLGVVVIESDKVKPGPSNVNLQIKSTVAGFEALPKACTHILKTRTDQRLGVGRDFLAYFRDLQCSFPVSSASVLCERLIVGSLPMSYGRSYPVPDFWMFGSVRDMKLYWDVPFDLRESSPEIPVGSERMFVQFGLGEAHFLVNFFQRVGYQPEWSARCSRRFLAMYLCVVDPVSVDQFWYKYHWYLQGHRKRSKRLLSHDAIGFAEWLRFYREFEQSENSVVTRTC